VAVIRSIRRKNITEPLGRKERIFLIMNFKLIISFMLQPEDSYSNKSTVFDTNIKQNKINQVKSDINLKNNIINIVISTILLENIDAILGMIV
jgi:hypothetical protein